MRTSYKILLIAIPAIFVVYFILTQLLGSFVSKHIECKITDIVISNVKTGMEISDDTHEQIKNIHITASPNYSLPIDVYNFSVTGHFNDDLLKMIYSPNIYINNSKGDSPGLLELHNCELDFSFDVKTSGETDEQILQWVKESQFQIIAHTIFPLVSVSFYVMP